MDSIVDTFFPLIDFIEGESNEVDNFLSDPLGSSSASKPAPSGVGFVGAQKVYDESVVGIVVESGSSIEKEKSSEKDKGSHTSSEPSLVTKATIKRKAPTTLLRGLRMPVVIPTWLVPLVPVAFRKAAHITYDSTMLVDANGIRIVPLTGDLTYDSQAMNNGVGHAGFGRQTMFDRTAMLKRIADTRKLVTALSRLLIPKTDVVRALRKRTQVEGMGNARTGDPNDIAIYIGDLYGKLSVPVLYKFFI